jgi:hypothetical protein
MTDSPQVNADSPLELTHSPLELSEQDGMWLDLLGTPFFVNLEKLDAPLRARARQLWARCASDGPHPESVSVEFSGREASEAEAMAELTMALTQYAIEHSDPAKQLLIHACALADAEGNATGFIGQSGAGKTTAASQLGQKFQYLTDETVALDLDTFRVLEFAKPLSVVAASGPKHQKSPDELGLRPVANSATLKNLYFLNRVSGSDELTLEQLDWREALELLVPQVSYLERRATPLLDLFAIIRRFDGIKRVTYSDASQLQELVGISASGSGANFAEPRSVELPELIPGQVYMVPGGVGSLRPTDAVFVGDQLVILAKGRVTVLEALPSEIWRLAFESRRFDELLDLLKESFPTDGMSDDDLSSALDTILRQMHDVGAVIYGGPRPADFVPGKATVDLSDL